MNATRETRSELIAAARRLFARHGYAGASIRAITALAGANLGAVTYHFRSKRLLYDAVLDSVARPLREQLRAAAASAPRPLDGLAELVRSFHTQLVDNPDVPALMLHDVSLNRPTPAPVRQTMQEISALAAALIRSGQEDGSIVMGDPILLTVSIVAQPIYFGLMRERLRSVLGLDPDDPGMRRQVSDHMVEFVRRSLAASGREA